MKKEKKYIFGTLLIQMQFNLADQEKDFFFFKGLSLLFFEQ
jgi:hypothetical protein